MRLSSAADQAQSAVPSMVKSYVATPAVSRWTNAIVLGSPAFGDPSRFRPARSA